jgi:hypothetical protein
MLVEAKLREYLNEIREEVCSRCAGRPVEGSFTPCGGELPLPQLIEAILRGPSDPFALPLACPWDQGGAARAGPGRGRFCPCPLDKVARLAVAAAEDLERRHQRRQHLLDLWGD